MVTVSGGGQGTEPWEERGQREQSVLTKLEEEVLVSRIPRGSNAQKTWEEDPGDLLWGKDGRVKGGWGGPCSRKWTQLKRHRSKVAPY